MNFLIIGCSWGVPNYFGPPGDPPESHIEFRLRSAGHNVFNCAQNEGSNLLSIEHAKLFLKGDCISHPAANTIKLENLETKIDWIIWFQTEFIRDEKVVLHSRRKIENIARHTYSTFKDFIVPLGSRLALIGGNSDLHPCYREYLNPDFVIPSWSSLILNEKIVELDINDPEVEFKFIDNEMRLQKLKSKSSLFPDCSHPGSVAHSNLVEQFLKCVTNSNL